MQSKYLHAGMQLQAGLIGTVHNIQCVGFWLVWYYPWSFNYRIILKLQEKKDEIEKYVSTLDTM